MALAGLSGGCGSIFYAQTPTGAFKGRLDVEWIMPNQFIYRPHAANPLVYTASDGRTIQPRAMYTDGGSIPRLFWSASGLGPWDYAPGYIIHDWLFAQRRCREGDWEAYDFPRSAAILAEAIKTQMEKAAAPEPTLLWAIHEAVSTPVARALWDGGTCLPPPPEAPLKPPPAGAAGAPAGGAGVAPVRIMTIEF